MTAAHAAVLPPGRALKFASYLALPAHQSPALTRLAFELSRRGDTLQLIKRQRQRHPARRLGPWGPAAPVDFRDRSAWSMALVELRDDDPMIRMQHPELDPYCAPGAMGMCLIDEFCAAGQHIRSPLSWRGRPWLPDAAQARIAGGSLSTSGSVRSSACISSSGPSSTGSARAGSTMGSSARKPPLWCAHSLA